MPQQTPLTVSLSHPAGFYERNIRLTLRTADSQAAIYYTLDGSLPVAGESAMYRTPLLLMAEPEGVQVVRAQAVRPDGMAGPVVTASYFMGIEAAVPVISLVVEPSVLWDEDEGLLENPDERSVEWERPSHITYLDENQQIGFALTAGIRLHGGVSRWSPKQSLRLYFRSEYGESSLDYSLFPGSDVTHFKRLVLHAGGQDKPSESGNGNLLRNALVTQLTSELDVAAAQMRPVVLYLNGQLWGVYNVRERIDRFFFADHFGIEAADFVGAVLYEREPMEGSWENWEQLAEYVEAHDLTDPAAYAYVTAQIDLENFIDYHALQIYIGNIDWPKNNHDRFRSLQSGAKWHWIVWDTDASFALAPWADLSVDSVARLFSPEDEKLYQESMLFRKLMENPAFVSAFVARMAELLATTFSAEAVIAHIDALEAQYAPLMDYETLRWPPAGNWQASVAEMRLFAEKRPFLVREQLLAQLGENEITAVLLQPTSDSAVPPVVILDFGADSDETGDWIELEVIQDGGVDMRGWRLTDNDMLVATDEGSLIFSDHAALADIPPGTHILVVATQTDENDALFPSDDLELLDGLMVLYVGNDNLDTTYDPWFDLVAGDNVSLVAPGATASFSDDLLITQMR